MKGIVTKERKVEETDEVFEGHRVCMIKKWAKEGDMQFKQMLKEYRAHKLFMHTVYQENPELKDLRLDERGNHHLESAVSILEGMIKDKIMTTDDIGKIIAHDNGSRGLAKTMHVQIFDKNGGIRWVGDLHEYKYHWM